MKRKESNHKTSLGLRLIIAFGVVFGGVVTILKEAVVAGAQKVKTKKNKKS